MAKKSIGDEYKTYPTHERLLRIPARPTTTPIRERNILNPPEPPNPEEIRELSIAFVEGCREIDGAPKFINQFDIECRVNEGNIILDRETGRLKIDGVTFPTEVEKVYTDNNKMYIKLKDVGKPIVVGQKIELPRELETTQEDIESFRMSCVQAGGNYYEMVNNWLCKVDGVVISLRKNGIVFVSGKVNAETYLHNIKLEEGKLIIKEGNKESIISI